MSDYRFLDGHGDWPQVELIGPRLKRLTADYVVEWLPANNPRQRLVVPAGFEFDGASVPGLAEWAVPRDPLLPAATVHDWHYAHAGDLPGDSHLVLVDGRWAPMRHLWSRRESDVFFRELLMYCDVGWGQRWAAYLAVRAGGWAAWRRAS